MTPQNALYLRKKLKGDFLNLLVCFLDLRFFYEIEFDSNIQTKTERPTVYTAPATVILM